MFRIDTATAALLKPAYPAEGPEKYFQDTEGTGGTIVPAWFLNQVQEEITTAIEDAGLTPEKNDDSQLSAAITILAGLAARGTLSENYLHVREEQNANTAGGTFTSGAWRVRTLNTVKTNTISGASLDAGTSIITLPAGTYDLRARLPNFRVNSNVGRVYNITGSAVLVYGASGQSNSSVAANFDTAVTGRFSLASPSTLRVEHYCESTFSTTGFGSPSNLDSAKEVYTEVEIWKVA